MAPAMATAQEAEQEEQQDPAAHERRDPLGQAAAAHRDEVRVQPVHVLRAQVVQGFARLAEQATGAHGDLRL